MAYAFSYDAPGTPEVDRLVSERLGSEPPDGLLVHVVTAAGAGLRHLNVWESKEQWERFRDTRVHSAVGSVLAELEIPAPVEPPVEHVLELVDVSTAAVS